MPDLATGRGKKRHVCQIMFYTNSLRSESRHTKGIQPGLRTIAYPSALAITFTSNEHFSADAVLVTSIFRPNLGGNGVGGRGVLLTSFAIKTPLVGVEQVVAGDAANAARPELHRYTATNRIRILLCQASRLA